MADIRKKFRLGRLATEFSWRDSKSLWGRFGGGWQWELGFQAGGHTIIVNLLFCSVRLHWETDLWRSQQASWKAERAASDVSKVST